MHPRTLLPLALWCLVLLLPVWAQSPLALDRVPQIPYTRFTLPNGMRVILSEDHTVPVVTESMIFDVGGRQEHPGRSGFAHLFEHLMFEGSQHAPKGVFDHLVEGYGGSDNASTHTDYTFYYETVPSNALPILMWLDADRLASLNVTETNMKNQISVVEEEKRMRVDNQPYGPLLYVDIGDSAFSNWQNAHPVIGSFRDLNAATLSDVKAFFDAYYAPRNGILTIVGDIDPVKTEAMVRKYFGWIPNRGVIHPVNTKEPEQTKEKQVVVHDAHANLPALAIAWQGPPRNSKDYYALAVLGELLFSGTSSRLYQSLVKQQQVAIDVEGGLGFPESDFVDYRAPGLFGGFVIQKAGSRITPDLIEQFVFREIHEIEANGVSDTELTRTKTKIAAEWVGGQQTTLERARRLAIAGLMDGNPETANTLLDMLLRVRSEDIQQAAAHYLNHARVTVVMDEPGAAPPVKTSAKAQPQATGKEKTR